MDEIPLRRQLRIAEGTPLGIKDNALLSKSIGVPLCEQQGDPLLVYKGTSSGLTKS